MILSLIVAISFLGTVLSLFIAFIFSKANLSSFNDKFTSFAVGALLGTAFLEIIPHAFELNLNFHYISLLVLVGIFGFFVLEKLFIWRHCHHSDHCETHNPKHHRTTNSFLLIVGDCFHNFVDGILISSAFLVNINLGLITSLAIILHEIPQEISNFIILIKSGYSLKKDLLMNLVSGFAMILGAVIAFFVLSSVKSFIPIILAFAASSMIYVAISDLIPTLHEKTDTKTSIYQVLLISFGILAIFYLHRLAH
jgi:zinc and cadmium transporter